MARRTLIWHLGLPQAPRPVVPASLEARRDALAEAGVLVAASPDEATAATHDLLRTHRAAGLSRREVEGTWARVCARVWDHKGISVVSTPELASAGKDEVRLALDPLRGVEVHLVLGVEALSAQVYGAWLDGLRRGAATGWEKYAERVLARPGDDGVGSLHRQHEEFWAGHDLPALLARWGWTLHDERVHVVADRDPRRTWERVVELAGLAPVDVPAELPAYADPAGGAVLRRVNRQLDRASEGDLRPLAPATSTLLLARPEGSPDDLPVVATDRLRPLVEGWAGDLAASSYDVRGDLLDLLDADDPRTTGRAALPGRRDQLAVAVDSLADALAENTRLRAENDHLRADRDRLDRKRRKLKRRLRAAR